MPTTKREPTPKGLMKLADGALALGISYNRAHSLGLTGRLKIQRGRDSHHWYVTFESVEELRKERLAEERERSVGAAQ